MAGLQYVLNSDGTVNLIDQDGIFATPEAEAIRLLRAGTARPASREVTQQWHSYQAEAKEYDSPVKAGLISGVNTALFGLPGWALRGTEAGEDMRKYAQHNPASTTIGEIGGLIGSAVVPIPGLNIGIGAKAAERAGAAVEQGIGKRLLEPTIARDAQASAAAQASMVAPTSSLIPNIQQSIINTAPGALGTKQLAQKGLATLAGKVTKGGLEGAAIGVQAASARQSIAEKPSFSAAAEEVAHNTLFGIGFSVAGATLRGGYKLAKRKLTDVIVPKTLVEEKAAVKSLADAVINDRPLMGFMESLMAVDSTLGERAAKAIPFAKDTAIKLTKGAPFKISEAEAVALKTQRVMLEKRVAAAQGPPFLYGGPKGLAKAEKELGRFLKSNRDKMDEAEKLLQYRAQQQIEKGVWTKVDEDLNKLAEEIEIAEKAGRLDLVESLQQEHDLLLQKSKDIIKERTKTSLPKEVQALSPTEQQNIIDTAISNLNERHRLTFSTVAIVEGKVISPTIADKQRWVIQKDPRTPTGYSTLIDRVEGLEDLTTRTISQQFANAGQRARRSFSVISALGTYAAFNSFSMGLLGLVGGSLIEAVVPAFFKSAGTKGYTWFKALSKLPESTVGKGLLDLAKAGKFATIQQLSKLTTTDFKHELDNVSSESVYNGALAGLQEAGVEDSVANHIATFNANRWQLLKDSFPAKISARSLASYSITVDAASDPRRALLRVLSGQVHKEDLLVMQTLAPELFQQILAAAEKNLSTVEDYNVRKWLQSILNNGTSPSTTKTAQTVSQLFAQQNSGGASGGASSFAQTNQSIIASMQQRRQRS